MKSSIQDSRQIKEKPQAHQRHLIPLQKWHSLPVEWNGLGRGGAILSARVYSGLAFSSPWIPTDISLATRQPYTWTTWTLQPICPNPPPPTSHPLPPPAAWQQVNTRTCRHGNQLHTSSGAAGLVQKGKQLTPWQRYAGMKVKAS